jgi:penicillin-binding protein A
MKALIRNIKTALAVFLILSLALMAGLVIQQNRSKNELFVAAGENKAALKTRYAAAGTIFDRSGSVLAQSRNGSRHYAEDATTAKAVLHIVGDYTHNIDNTIEARYQGSLLGTGRNLAHQLLLDVNGVGLQGDDITLTVDAGLAKKAYQMLNGRRGAVVLINYQTGEVLVSVSSPSTSPASVIAFKDIPDTALFNRALFGAYAPGSTFKILTAAAWLQSATYDANLTVDCQGHSTVNDNGADETGSGHGPVGLTEAFAQSCNVYFGQLGASLGQTKLAAIANDFGYGTLLSADKLDVATSRIAIVDDPAVLSWLAIGQPVETSVLSMSPLQLAMIAGAIGNEGVMMQPHLVDHLTDPLGIVYQKQTPSIAKAILDSITAASLEQLMVDVTENGTGQAAAISGWTVAGKTGTVQVTGKKNTALYVGYIVEDECPYAIAVVIEEGGSGGKVAAPIAAKLLKAATRLG